METDPKAGEAAAEHRLWGGRFVEGMEAAAAELNRSLPVDYRLWPQDVRASKAWVKALARAGVLQPEEEAQLCDGLECVAQRLADGAGVGAPDEDVHTLVERLLYQEVGELAGKLNTGRSRNDQVATDLRLWGLEASDAVERELVGLGRALLGQAKRGLDLYLPGYTHGQRAQPVRWGYVLLAHAWPLTRDRARLADAARRMAELPLGSGALAGSSVTVDRDFLAGTLGFDRPASNALDVTGDRDFAAELLFALALLATHMSRLAGELLTYASSEYGFIRLADGYCTGSSLLPHKRNPDVFELARAKSARVLSDLAGLLSLLKALPAGYSKDLQEDKAFLFDAVDTMLLTLPAVRGAVETLEPVPERMAAALDRDLLATDLAEGLAAAGVPFREAHGLVGRLVKLAETRGLHLGDVPPDEAGAIHPLLPSLVASLDSWEGSIERRDSAGGSSGASVAAQILRLEGEFQMPS
ncbi:MAG: argininosuccinate lyase [Gemmatimonadales bacterium]|nr:argininosuccinate lyase [Gemmatimonadales bacterium]NIN10729.1 argininosuccinate lyase [Gemmatimonadales bacterium]NIQ98959.1 argininosuccinate lyase [Gemmatimonadales bacterium]NIS63778.1 argininosuccinate lyase [Gemmatimonadales bacterium]